MSSKPIGPGAHGAIDYGFVALQALAPRLFGLRGAAQTLRYAFVLPWLTGALKQRNARRYFFSFFAVALANYLLTDYQAYEKAPAPNQQS